jgi:hypothetical protein
VKLILALSMIVIVSAVLVIAIVGSMYESGWL